MQPEIENHSLDASNEYLLEKWTDEYNGIQRANDAIREVALVKDGSVSAAYGAQVIAEAKFCVVFLKWNWQKFSGTSLMLTSL